MFSLDQRIEGMRWDHAHGVGPRFDAPPRVIYVRNGPTEKLTAITLHDFLVEQAIRTIAGQALAASVPRG